MMSDLYFFLNGLADKLVGDLTAGKLTEKWWWFGLRWWQWRWREVNGFWRCLRDNCDSSC